MAKKITSSLGGTKTDALPESPQMRKAPQADQPPSGYTVSGIPIEQIPGGHLIGRGNTDQGIAERLEKPHAFTTAGADQFDKSIQERRDFREHEEESWLAPDPMKEINDKYLKPGFSGKFLSRSVIARNGLRGFEVTLDKGNEVTLGNMVHGQMPIENVRRRNKKYQDLGLQQMAEVANGSREELARLSRDAGVRPSTREAKAEEGLHESRGGNDAVLF